MKPLVSVIITTKNEEKNIEKCIKGIIYQTYENVEIIVVDNNSTDKTKEISKEYTKKVFNFGPERSSQRNFGMIKKAKGKYVMFLDADMIISPSLIEKSVGNMEKNNFVALYIPEIVLGKKYFSKVRRFERLFYNGTSIDGARFFRRDVFKKIKGFDEKLYACEDWDLDKKIKKIGKIKILEEKEEKIEEWKLKEFIFEKGVNPLSYGVVIYHNESEFNIKKYLIKKSYYSKNFFEYINKWGKEDEDIKKQFGFYYRFFGVFVENGKWRKFVKKPFLIIGLYYLRFLVGLNFIIQKKK
jgi:glycosyltransferase involved in cell wall biosynthesis